MIRIALAQINPTVGDIPGNTARIIAGLKEARRAGARLAVFPEMAVTGYPPEDLVFKPAFIQANLEALEKIARQADGLAAVVGFIDRGDDIYNAAAVIDREGIRAVYHKHLLPNYSVFDEERYFKAGRNNALFQLGELRFAVNICEDIWHPSGPMAEQAAAGSQLIVNISASPYQYGKVEYKERMLAGRAADYSVFLAYVNLVGGQDELVFDGQSLVFDPKGQLLARARPFETDLLVVDLEIERILKRRIQEPRLRKTPSRSVPLVTLSAAPPARVKTAAPRIEAHLPETAEVYRALVTGTRDYVEKNGFRKVLIGLSGGIDSALTAAVAVDALGKERVVGLYMPGPYSARISGEDSRKLAENLGIEFDQVPIRAIFRTYLETLRKPFAGRKPDAAEENIQARIRGNLIMAFSNKFGYLVLTTGNKSEIATGYCTLYGDMAGGFAVLKDIPKTLVYRLAEYRNGQRPDIPERSLTRPPTAELRPNQKDSDSLPPYERLDPILKLYIEENLAPAEIAGGGTYREAEVRAIVEKVDRNEYKRRQAPPGVKITGRAFGKDWRLPITNRFRNGG